LGTLIPRKKRLCIFRGKGKKRFTNHFSRKKKERDTFGRKARTSVPRKTKLPIEGGRGQEAVGGGGV